MTDDPKSSSKPKRVLVRPGTTQEEHREAAIKMSIALRGREPTEEEFRELDEAIAKDEAEAEQ